VFARHGFVKIADDSTLHLTRWRLDLRTSGVVSPAWFSRL
jgi:hypothetical protein